MTDTLLLQNLKRAFNARLAQSNLIIKTDFDNELVAGLLQINPNICLLKLN